MNDIQPVTSNFDSQLVVVPGEDIALVESGYSRYVIPNSFPS